MVFLTALVLSSLIIVTLPLGHALLKTKKDGFIRYMAYAKFCIAGAAVVRLVSLFIDNWVLAAFYLPLAATLCYSFIRMTEEVLGVKGFREYARWVMAQFFDIAKCMWKRAAD